MVATGPKELIKYEIPFAGRYHFGSEIPKMKQGIGNYVIKRTAYGLGLFTLKPIPKGKRLVEYTGPFVSNAEVESRPNGKYFFWRQHEVVDRRYAAQQSGALHQSFMPAELRGVDLRATRLDLVQASYQGRGGIILQLRQGIF